MKKVTLIVLAALAVLAAALWFFILSGVDTDTKPREYSLTQTEKRDGLLLTVWGYFPRKSWDVSVNNTSAVSCRVKTNRTNRFAVLLKPAGNNALSDVVLELINEADAGYGYHIDLCVFVDGEGHIEVLTENHTGANNQKLEGTLGEMSYRCIVSGTEAALSFSCADTAKWTYVGNMGDSLLIKETSIGVFTLTGRAAGTGTLRFSEQYSCKTLELSVTSSDQGIITILSAEEFDDSAELEDERNQALLLLESMGKGLYPKSLDPAKLSGDNFQEDDGTNIQYVSMELMVDNTILHYCVYGTTDTVTLMGMVMKDGDEKNIRSISGREVTLLNASRKAVWREGNNTCLLYAEENRETGCVLPDAETFATLAAVVLESLDDGNE